MSDQIDLFPTNGINYRLYMKSPEWRIRRQDALERAGFHCSLNPEHLGALEVHHTSYKRLGAELPEDLIVLCGECHGRFHQTLPVPPYPRTELVKRALDLLLEVDRITSAMRKRAA